MATTTKAKAKAMNKSQLLTAVSDMCSEDKATISRVLDGLGAVMANELGADGPGVFQIPGLLKITKIVKPAREAGTKPNPFRPGETMDVKARPAKNVVKIRPLKALKDMVAD